MKRLAFVLATALFALTACTPAAETATAADPATTPPNRQASPLLLRPAHSILTATAMRRMLSMMSCPPLMTS